MIDSAIFARRLDLSPLGRRQRGVVSCCFHTDKHPSLSLDLERGLFHCFSCGNKGGLVHFATLVGERARSRPRGAARPRSDYEIALERALAGERAAAARRAEWLPLWLVSDHLRHRGHVVQAARRWAQRLGPDHPKSWPILGLAQQVETETYVIEAQLDALLAEGRIG